MLRTNLDHPAGSTSRQVDHGEGGAAGDPEGAAGGERSAWEVQGKARDQRRDNLGGDEGAKA